MSRVYATEDNTKRRLLVRLDCDGDDCEDTIKPHPEIAKSGWTKRGWHRGPGTEIFEQDYCPGCSRG